ncbi:MAG: lipoate--protein ligase family protein [Treponema sp.]|nr:lipoate--protein ligase family protein [Treponema sp.]
MPGKIMYPFRLLSTGFNDCFSNMGLDEALLESVAGCLPGGGYDGQPILRFYGWNPPAISIGYFQNLADEVDIQAAKQYGFDLVRRISGGGTVLHRSELTYSIIIGLDHPLAGKDLDDSYRILCQGLIQGLGFLGIESVFSGTNDILSGGKKISGNAQTRRMNCLLQHGTILLDNDAEIMFEVLKVPKEKNKGKLISEIKERLGSLRSILGCKIDFDEAESVFTRGFADALGLLLNKSEISIAEKKRAVELAEAKYKTSTWLGACRTCSILR